MRSLVAAAALAALLAGCTTSSKSAASKVEVTAGDDTCVVAQTTFEKPSTISFAVHNTGGDVTEVYVYAKGSSGHFDKVVGEVENIAPGTSRDFEVSLGSGAYDVACKPGQKGDGIRVRVTVEGKATSAAEVYDRQIAVAATDDAFQGLGRFSVKVGETIKFRLENHSRTKQHEFEVFGPDGKAIGEVGPTSPGGRGEVILTFTKAGTYTYESGIGDDASRGLKGSFRVT